MYKIQKIAVIVSILLLTFKCYGVRSDEIAPMSINYRVYDKEFQTVRESILGTITHDMRPIRPHHELAKLAKAYTLLMIETGEFSHDVVDDWEAFTFLYIPNLKKTHYVLENLFEARNYNKREFTEKDVVHAWDDSQPHWAGIYSEINDYYGLYGAYSADGTLYITKYVARKKR